MGPGLRRDDDIVTACVYILASRRYGTLYIGVTSDLANRIVQHRDGLVPGFTKRYGIKRLVHVETFETMPDAIQREKRLKEWKRDWKIRLIEEHNSTWDDLATALFGLPQMESRDYRPARPNLADSVQNRGH